MNRQPYKSEKRRKEIARQKKQEEKRQKRAEKKRAKEEGLQVEGAPIAEAGDMVQGIGPGGAETPPSIPPAAEDAQDEPEQTPGASEENRDP